MGLFDFLRKKTGAGAATTPAAAPVLGPDAHAADGRTMRSVGPLLQWPSCEEGFSVARDVEAIVRSATPEEILQIEVWYPREYEYATSRLAWEQLRLRPVPAWAADFPSTIALATCHRSGHVREAAVRILSTRDEGFLLPFLLIRLNDWVPQVRFVAATPAYRGEGGGGIVRASVRRRAQGSSRGPATRKCERATCRIAGRLRELSRDPRELAS